MRTTHVTFYYPTGEGGGGRRYWLQVEVEGGTVFREALVRLPTSPHRTKPGSFAITL